MSGRIKVVDIELSRPLSTIEDLQGYVAVHGVIRLHGTPLGYFKAPVVNDRCTASSLRQRLLDKHTEDIAHGLLENSLSAPPPPGGLRLDTLWDLTPPAPPATLPSVTVAVCTRDRTDNLPVCLDSLCRLDYDALDLLVVDNAPSSDATERLVRENYPRIRYVCEPRPGLDWARNRAILEAKGEIVAYADDDVVVDPTWVTALATVFAENADVMAVTGLIVPYELETEAQQLFEHYGGFGRGYRRMWARIDHAGGAEWGYHGTGQYGTGANMAFRRRVFDEIGYFDPALDVGTVTNGGGDLEMLFRVLKEGHTLVYEPRALVQHIHRREYGRFRTQIANNGIGTYAYLARTALAYPEERWPAFRFGWWWLWRWEIRSAVVSFLVPRRLPRELRMGELRGSFSGLTRYQKARRRAAQIIAEQGDTTPPTPKSAPRKRIRRRETSTAVRTVDLCRPLAALSDLADFPRVRVFVTRADQPLGTVEIKNLGQSVSAARLRDAIVSHLGMKSLSTERPVSEPMLWAEMLTMVGRRLAPTPEPAADMPAVLPAHIPVSVVVATYDRPADLRECLRCLTAQQTPRPIEIIVVDNHPASGLTPPIVAEFPGIVLVTESRQGLSYARNAGFATSRGEIAIATDDDVEMPPDWLEKLVAPFARADVMIVTGNVLPQELTTKPQRLFETYGGLGRGFEPFTADGDWFEGFTTHAVPTWELGATANAAFRAALFSDPQVGMMDEALGAGSPTGCSEDTYFFYKTLKAYHTVVYEPTAYVWHKHRRTMASLRRQIYNYSKGHAAYNLTTALRDNDLRGLARIFVTLPRIHAHHLLYKITRRLRPDPNPNEEGFPISLILLEIAGNLAGPWALLRSRLRVMRLGRSKPYQAAALRSPPVSQDDIFVESPAAIIERVVRTR